jgi:serine/threonine protein kinase
MQDSPYTIHLFDALEDDYSVYIVTEICTGGDLEDLIAVRLHLLSRDPSHCFFAQSILGCHLIYQPLHIIAHNASALQTYDNRIVPEADLARCIRQVLEFLQVGCWHRVQFS